MKNKLAGNAGAENWKREYFSIPNLMGYFRILLVPVFAALYLRADSFQDYLVAALVLGVSALTDCFDGKVARRFNMVTEWGKFVDPLADKLTQGVTALCLTTRYPTMAWVVGVLVVKELILAVLGAVFLHFDKKLDGASLCGKVATVFLDCSMIVLLLMPDLDYAAANILMYLCIGFMLYALVGYLLIYRRMWFQVEKKKLSRRAGVFSGLLVLVLFAGYLLAGSIVPVLEQPEVSPDYQDAFSIDAFYGDTACGDRAALIGENQEALDMRLRMIAQAQERVILSTFDIQSDEAGIQVLAALYDAAQRGVQVQLLADGMRSITNMEGNPYFYALSSHENAEIRIYNQISLLRPWTIMGRLHDKYLIVDDDLYLLGGRNTFRYFLGETDGTRNYDWDVLVYHAGEGEGSLAQLEAYFESVWNSEYCTVFHDRASTANAGSVRRAAARLEALYARRQAEQPELFSGYDYEAATCETEQITLVSGETGTFSKEPRVFYTLCRLMERAAENVTIHTPYVICNDMMLNALGALTEGTADVRLMTNSVANNGNPFGAAYYQEDRETLLEEGITLLEYDGGVSYHGKCIAIDRELSIVGSFNMDMRSAYLDTELMLVIDSEAFNARLRAGMAEYESQSLTVLEDGTALAPEGHTAQETPPGKAVLLDAIRLLLGWAKFLM